MSATAVRARKLGEAYETRTGGYRWQWYALDMSDGTERHTSVPAGPRAAAEARRNVSECEHSAEAFDAFFAPLFPCVNDHLGIGRRAKSVTH